MKRLLFLCILIPVFSQAQIGASTRLIGINGMGNSSTSDRGVSFFSLSATAYTGTFFYHNLCGGLSLSYDLQREKDKPVYKASASVISIGPFLRYYANFGKSAIVPEIGFQINRFGSQEKYERSPRVNTSSAEGGLTGSIGLGYNYFVTPRFALEFMPKYVIILDQLNHGIISDGLNSGNGNDRFQFKLGFQFFMQKQPVEVAIPVKN